MISYGAFLGAAGFSMTCFHNLVRKLPAMRRPWEHVVAAGACYWLGSQIPAFKARQLAEIEKIEGGREALAQARGFRVPKTTA